MFLLILASFSFRDTLRILRTKENEKSGFRKYEYATEYKFLDLYENLKEEKTP